jgi:hypothetical protein
VAESAILIQTEHYADGSTDVSLHIYRPLQQQRTAVVALLKMEAQQIIDKVTSRPAGIASPTGHEDRRVGEAHCALPPE